MTRSTCREGHSRVYARCLACNPNDEHDAGLGCVLIGFLIVLGCMGAALFQAASVPQGFAP